MATRPTIVIPKATDPKYGWLSASSSHSFTIDEKLWPSVMHYMIAKQFEGTMLEDEIRKSKSVMLAKMLSNRRCRIVQEEGRLVKRVVYGLNTQLGYQSRLDWNEDIKRKYLELASKSKFDQNPRLRKKLLDTEGLIIVDNEIPDNGDVIAGIRQVYIAERDVPNYRLEARKYRSLDLPLIDLKLDILSPFENQIVDRIMIVAEWVREIEGLTASHPEIFEDAIYNIVPASIAEDLVQSLKAWIETISPKWSLIVIETPRFEKLVENLEKKISVRKLPSFGKTENLRVAILISGLIKWLRNDVDKEIATLISNKVKNIKRVDVFIPPVLRSYRKGLPLRVFKRHVVQKLSPDALSLKRIISEVKGMNSIRMSESSKGALILRGKTLEKYRPQLLAIGGRVKGETLEIPQISHAKAADLFFGDIPETAKIKSAYLSWWHQRIGMLLDTAQQLVRLTSAKTITSKIMKTVVTSIYSFSPRTFTPSTTILAPNDIHKLSNKVMEVLAPVGTLSESLVSSLATNLSYIEYFQMFDRDCGWERIPSQRVLSKFFTNEEVILLHALKNIIDVVTAPENGINYGLSIESATWAFLVLCPPKNARFDAEQYLRSVLEKWSETFDIDQTKKYLSKMRVYSELDHIQSIIPQVSNAALVVMAIALTFTKTRQKEFDDRCALLRGKTPTNNHEVTLEIKETVDIPTSTSGDSNSAESLVDNHPEQIDVKGKVIDAPKSNLLEFDGSDLRWIIIVANATSLETPIPKTPSEIITDKAYAAYQYANVYLSQTIRRVGDVIVSIPRDDLTKVRLESTSAHRHVITFIAEHSSGGPKKVEDTIENRKKWFAKSLKDLVKIVRAGESIGIAYDTLCPGYREAIEDIARLEGFTFYILGAPKGKGKLPIKAERKFTGERVPLISIETIEDENTRAVLYLKTFKPHLLSDEDYSKLVSHLERCTPKTRQEWLEMFVSSSFVDQESELRDILRRL